MVKALKKLGYEKVSQRGSHMRLVTMERGRNRVIVTDEKRIPVGTLRDVLGYVAKHADLSIRELLEILDL